MPSRWMLLLGGLFVGLVAAEIVCRFTVPNPITGPPDENRRSWRVEGLVNDPLVEFSFQPGYSGRMTLPDDYDVPFHINGQGLRADEDFPPEHPGRRRILLVGDSFVFGIGVELPQTLGAQLQAALDADGSGGPPVEVVPVGVPAYGLDQYAKLIERWVPKLHPDLVVVAMFPGNDLLDYDLVARNRHVVIEGRLVQERQAWSWGLRKYSVLAHLLLQRFNPIERIDRMRPTEPTPKELAHMYATMVPWIDRIAQAPGADGPPLSVFVVVGKEQAGQLRSAQWAKPGEAPQNAGAPALEGVLAAFRKHGCKVFDPSPEWAAIKGPLSPYFFAKDAHYSAFGNEFCARWLAARVRAAFPRELGGAPGQRPEKAAAGKR